MFFIKTDSSGDLNCCGIDGDITGDTSVGQQEGVITIQEEGVDFDIATAEEGAGLDFTIDIYIEGAGLDYTITTQEFDGNLPDDFVPTATLVCPSPD